MDANHIFISKNFEEKMNNLLKQTKEKEMQNKNKNLEVNFKKNVVKDSFQKEDVSQKEFLEEFGLLFVKKKITNLVCGKYLPKTFGFAFMSKTEFAF